MRTVRTKRMTIPGVFALAFIFIVSWMSTPSLAASWDYDSSAIQARLKISEDVFFDVGCKIRGKADLIGRIEASKYFQIYFHNYNTNAKWGTESDRKGRYYMSFNKKYFLDKKEITVSFRYIFGDNKKFKKTGEMAVRGTEDTFAKLETACADAEPPVIWAHGNSCPAETELSKQHTTETLFRDGSIQSGALVFKPQQNGTDQDWCKKAGAFFFQGAGEMDIYEFDALQWETRKDHIREFGCTIKQLCPKMETVAYTQTDKYGVKFFFSNSTVTANFVPLTDKEFVQSTVHDGPSFRCDTLAAHPLDKLKPIGVKGVLEGQFDAKAAAEACEADLKKHPDVARLQFQLGRAYLMLGLHQKAFSAFRIAAQKEYPMGVLYLGHSYANGWGTNEDLRKANINWRKSRELGAFSGDARKLELAVAKATGRPARVICRWNDKDCERKARRPHYTSSITTKQAQLMDETFSDIHPDLRAVYVGFAMADFEGLQLTKYAILDRSTGQGTATGLLSSLFPGVRDAMETATERSRFEPVIAQYALIKTNLLGTCGELSQKFEVTHTVTTTWRNGFGVELSSVARETGKTYFSVPARFADLIKRADTKGEWATYAVGVKSFIRRFGDCNSKVLKLLEKNMFDYVAWKPKPR